MSHPPLSTTPTAVKPALSEALRVERLRSLTRRLRSPQGLDRDALRHIERLTGERQALPAAPRPSEPVESRP